MEAAQHASWTPPGSPGSPHVEPLPPVRQNADRPGHVVWVQLSDDDEDDGHAIPGSPQEVESEDDEDDGHAIPGSPQEVESEDDEYAGLD